MAIGEISTRFESMDSPTFTVGLLGIIMPSNAAVENTCPTAAQDIHALGKQEQNRLFVFLANPRHVNRTPCREKLANHLHRE